MQNLQELKNLENDLLGQLEAILTNLSAVRKTKSLLEGKVEVLQEKNHSVNALIVRTAPAPSREAFDAILATAEDCLKNAGDKPVFIRDIKQFIESKGVVITGQNPGATLGALLRGDKRRFVLVDKPNRLWALKA